MADKDELNDEYQFADLDSMAPDSGTEVQPIGENESPSDAVQDGNKKNNVKQKAIAVFALVIVIMIAYKLIASFFSDKKVPVSTLPAPVKVAAPITPIPSPQPAPVQAAASPSLSPEVNQQLSALESSQQNVQSGLAVVNNQLGGISKNVDAMSARIAELSAIIANLNAKVDEQAREIDQITIRRAAQRVPHIPRKKVHYPKYYIQAVIPGRAWLIATNGSTLTVRDGSTIAGYGVVKLIDPNQGRVLTSSGQVIKFSQEDS